MESSYPFETSRGAERCPAHIPTNLIAEALVQLLITSPLGTKDYKYYRPYCSVWSLARYAMTAY